MKSYFVYIMTNNTGTLYIGVTSGLENRVAEHKLGIFPGFTKQYGIKYLVYFEESQNVNSAIAREKQLKGWVRRKKINLIKSLNPGWLDLSMDPSAALRMTAAVEG